MLLGLWVLLAAEQATSQLPFFLSLVVSLPCSDQCFTHSSSDGREMRLDSDVRMHKHAPMLCMFGRDTGHAVVQCRRPGLLSMTDDSTVVMFTVMMVMFQGNADL
jgi:hypothetical protein